MSTFVGAFGASLRETRLMALLGSLIALEPEPFLNLFGFSGTARSVRLENRHQDDRSDILVETTAGTGVIEAKVGVDRSLGIIQKISKPLGGNKCSWETLVEQPPAGDQTASHAVGMEQQREKDLSFSFDAAVGIQSSCTKGEPAKGQGLVEQTILVV